MGQTCSEVCSAVVKGIQLVLFDISIILRIYGQNIYMLTSQLFVDPDIRRKWKTMMQIGLKDRCHYGTLARVFQVDI